MLFPMVKVDPGWVKTQMGGPHAHKSPEQGKIDISRQALLQWALIHMNTVKQTPVTVI